MKRALLTVMTTFTLGLTLALGASGNIDKREYVCMMQDMVLGKVGIPIEYEGKTYYGCCEMCKQKVKNEPQKYTRAIDPVSGKTVDKATAFIYNLEGSAYYFASETSRKTFATNPARYIKK